MRKWLKPSEAVGEITRQALRLKADADEALLEFYAEKVVAEVLSYCRLRDFPAPLVYAAAEGLLSVQSALEDSGGAVTGASPLSKIKQDDTEYTFAVNAVNAGASFSDLVFESLKARLQVYRRLVAW